MESFDQVYLRLTETGRDKGNMSFYLFYDLQE